MSSRRFFVTAAIIGLVGWAAIFVACAALAKAFAQTWVTATVTSYHLDRKGQNEVNPGIGFERSLSERWRWIAGGYVNSTNVTTMYAGAVYSRWDLGPARLGTLVALATGYDARPVLMAGPTLAIEGREMGANLIFIPAGRGVLGLQLKWRWQ